MAKETFNILFGSRVKYFRNLAKLSQEDLAEILNCSAVTISYIENGKNAIAFSKLPKLCKALNIEPYQLFLFDEDLIDANRLRNINKILESMTNAQLGVVYKLLLNFANLRVEDMPKTITRK